MMPEQLKLDPPVVEPPEVVPEVVVPPLVVPDVLPEVEPPVVVVDPDELPRHAWNCDEHLFWRQVRWSDALLHLFWAHCVRAWYCCCAVEDPF